MRKLNGLIRVKADSFKKQLLLYKIEFIPPYYNIKKWSLFFRFNWYWGFYRI
jgi:hypothetical protein